MSYKNDLLKFQPSYSAINSPYPDIAIVIVIMFVCFVCFLVLLLTFASLPTIQNVLFGFWWQAMDFRTVLFTWLILPNFSGKTCNKVNYKTQYFLCDHFLSCGSILGLVYRHTCSFLTFRL